MNLIFGITHPYFEFKKGHSEQFWAPFLLLRNEVPRLPEVNNLEVYKTLLYCTPHKTLVIMQNLKKLLALLVVVSFAVTSYAQSIGPKAGVNIASWAGDDELDDYGSITGLQFGAVIELPVSDKFAIQPELVYMRKGSGFDFEILGVTIETENQLNYFEIPILAKIFLTEGPTQVFVNAGPSIGFATSGKVISKSGDEEDEIDIDFEEDGISSFDFGVALGAGAQFDAGAGKFFVDIRYLLGLANLDDSEPEEDRIDVFNRGIGASIGFLFPLGQ